MNIFKIGQELSTISIGDSKCVLKAKIIKRTAHTVTIALEGYKIKNNRCKIHSDMNGEFIYPIGKFSMCPKFRA